MMTQISQVLTGWMNDEEGASMVEYGLLVALIAAVCLLAVSGLGTKVKATFDSVVSKL